MNTPLPSPLLGNREGTPVFGHFDAPVGEIRADQHKFRSPMGGFVTEQERNEAFRSFQFIGVVGVDMAAGCAITHTSSGMSAFAYLWVNGTFTQLRLGGRAGDTVTFAADPDNGRTELSTSRGSAIMDAGPDRKRLTVTSPDASLNLTFQDEGVLRLCTPTGPTGWTYVQKWLLYLLAGSLVAGPPRQTLKPSMRWPTTTTPPASCAQRHGGTGHV